MANISAIILHVFNRLAPGNKWFISQQDLLPLLNYFRECVNINRYIRLSAKLCNRQFLYFSSFIWNIGVFLKHVWQQHQLEPILNLIPTWRISFANSKKKKILITCMADFLGDELYHIHLTYQPQIPVTCVSCFLTLSVPFLLFVSISVTFCPTNSTKFVQWGFVNK